LRKFLCLTIGIAVVAAPHAGGAKYAGEAFKLGASARPLGFGGAYVALASDPSADLETI